MSQNTSQIIAEALTATGAATMVKGADVACAIQILGKTSSGTGAASVAIQVSNVPVPSVDGDWIDAGIATLTLGTTKTSEAVPILVPWKWLRANVNSISGTGASIDVYGCTV